MKAYFSQNPSTETSVLARFFGCISLHVYFLSQERVKFNWESLSLEPVQRIPRYKLLLESESCTLSIFMFYKLIKIGKSFIDNWNGTSYYEFKDLVCYYSRQIYCALQTISSIPSHDNSNHNRVRGLKNVDKNIGIRIGTKCT